MRSINDYSLAWLLFVSINFVCDYFWTISCDMEVILVFRRASKRFMGTNHCQTISGLYKVYQGTKPTTFDMVDRYFIHHVICAINLLLIVREDPCSRNWENIYQGKQYTEQQSWSHYPTRSFLFQVTHLINNIVWCI